MAKDSLGSDGNHQAATLRRLWASLPTAMAHGLAGWIAGGAGDLTNLALAAGGAGAFYLVFGLIPLLGTVGIRTRLLAVLAVVFAIVWLTSKTLLLMVGGGIAVLLLILVLALRLRLPDSPSLDALTRFGLLLMGSAGAAIGLSYEAVMAALGLACYSLGVRWLTGPENIRGRSQAGWRQLWPTFLIAMPVFVFPIVGGWMSHFPTPLYALVAWLWILWQLAVLFMRDEPDVPLLRGWLIAGFPLIDLISCGWDPKFTPIHGVIFAGLFGLAWLLKVTWPDPVTAGSSSKKKKKRR